MSSDRVSQLMATSWTSLLTPGTELYRVPAIIIPFVVSLALPGAYNDVICYDDYLHSCLWPIHRAKSEISYVFYVDDRCRIGLIHMSATNPIDEI